MGRSIPGPTQAIRVVARLTGIRAETLRMWERRYGFPLPARTPGGSRLYADSDVVRLKLIREAIENGYRPHEVVSRSEAELTQMLQAFRGQPVRGPIVSTGGPSVTAILDLLAREDVAGLRASLRSFALLLGPAGFVTELAAPLLTAVGEAWSTGALSVRHEHLASEYLSTQLRVLSSAHERTERYPSVLLATLTGEAHALGVDMVAVYLAARGASPRTLGASTPSAEIAASAIAQQVDVVAISVSVAVDVPLATRALEELRRALPRDMPLWVGGRGAARLRLPTKVTLVDEFSALDEAVERLPGSPRV